MTKMSKVSNWATPATFPKSRRTLMFVPRSPTYIVIVFSVFLVRMACAQDNPRARELGITFDGTTGPLNAITDVKGVEVGHTTLISGDGPLKVGTGPVRTGVTAVLPRGKDSKDPVFAGWFTLAMVR